MAESFIQVAPNSTGLKAHTNQRTIGANAVEDEYTLPGEYPLATYKVIGSGVTTTTANSHMLQIMAGASLNVRIRKFRISQVGAPGTVNVVVMQLWRLTTAGTGGGSVTARPHDSADAAAGASGMTLPTVKGTEGVQLDESGIWMGTASILPGALGIWEWTQQPGTKPIIIPAGATNGIAFKNTAGIASSTLNFTVEFVETNFV